MRKLVVVLISKLSALNDRICEEQNRDLFAHFKAVEGVQVSEEQAEPSCFLCVCVLFLGRHDAAEAEKEGHLSGLNSLPV